MYEKIRRHLAETLTGSQSYYPDGVQRDSRSRADDLEVFISSLKDLKNHVDDPSDVLGGAADDLEKIAKAFRWQIEEGEPVDNIQIPPEYSPNTMDNNIIHVDPYPGPYSSPNPVAPSQRSRDFRVSLQSPSSTENALGRQPTRGISSNLGEISSSRNLPLNSRGSWIAAMSGVGSTRPIQPATRQVDELRGIVSNQPMPDWPFPPPIFNRR